MPATSTMILHAQNGKEREEGAGDAGLEAQAEQSPYPVRRKFERPQSLPGEVTFVTVLCMAQFMTQAGFGQSIAPLKIVGDSFGVQNPRELSWMAAAYSLTVGTFILVAGRLGDIYGHKLFFIGGFLWFSLWSLLAGFSSYSSPVFFYCCRAFQGIGPALLLPNSIAIIGRNYEPGRRKDMVFSLYGATAPGGFVVGATFSALFGELVWWPWSYWAMAIACLLLAGAGFLIIPSTPRPKVDGSASVVARVDAWGAITGITGLVLVNFAWNQGPVAGWTAPYTYSLLIIGFIFIGLFGFIESRASFPLLPMAALSVDTAFVLGCIAAGWSSFGIWVFYTWQFMEELRGYSPLSASAYYFPVAISGLCAALTIGFVLNRLPASVVMLISMLAFTIGGVLIATAPVEQSYWAQTLISIIVMPWGMDMSFPAATILLSNAMPPEHQGIAASLVNTVINYSISIGLGFAGTIDARVNDGGLDLLKGYRGAWYMGIGMSSLGIFISMLFGLNQVLTSRRNLSRGAPA